MRLKERLVLIGKLAHENEIYAFLLYHMMNDTAMEAMWLHLSLANTTHAVPKFGIGIGRRQINDFSCLPVNQSLAN